ncbi:hypothetical protein DB346_03455 [Verrucomicrobia bacterium LW23]|nr:hypothetical protein DB346_03455 [Verrucomicrobia bacterium LW23]
MQFLISFTAMATLQLLATTLGLATLAGINLYLTVFVTGLALNMGWLHLAPGLESLRILGDPAIVTISGVLYFLEFFADKIRGFDVVWDAVHTAIRPIGAALIGLAALGTLDPQVEIIAIILCGTMALGTHAIKAGTRMVATVSPIPFTSAALSVGEDVLVVLGLLVAFFVNPWILVAMGALALLAVIYIGPWWYRQVRAVATYAYALVLGRPEHALSRFLPEAQRQAIQNELGADTQIAFAMPVFIGGMNGWSRSQRAWLVMTEGPRRLALVGARNPRMIEIRGGAVEASLRRLFLCSELLVHFPDLGRCWVVRCPQDRYAQLVAAHGRIAGLAEAPAPAASAATSSAGAGAVPLPSPGAA